MLKRKDDGKGGYARLMLELDGHEYRLAQHRDESEMLFAALEEMDGLIGGCEELLGQLDYAWRHGLAGSDLPSGFGPPSLERTLTNGKYGVAVKVGQGTLARATGSRRYEYNAARAALEAARARLDGWRGEVEAMYRRVQQAEMERASLMA